MLKKLAVILPILVVLMAIAFLAVHRRAGKNFTRAELREAAAQSFTFDQKLTLARAACSVDPKVNSKREISCPVCPAGSDFANTAGLPGGEPGWTMDSAMPGSFSAGNQQEALLHAVGCEPHLKNDGGNFLMRRSGDTWSTVRYASGGTATDACKKLDWPGGRDALVCERKDQHGGIASDAVQLLLFDEAKPKTGDFEHATFFAVGDESSNCGVEASLSAKPHPIQLAGIEEVQVLPADNQGRQDVAVQAAIRRVQPSAKANAPCPAGEPKSYRVVFQNVGDHFDAAEGYVALDAMKREDCCELVVAPRVVPGRY